MKNLFENKKFIIVSLSIIGILIVSLGCYKYYKNKQYARSEVNKISEQYTSFTNLKDGDKRFNLLKDLEKEYDVFLKSGKKTKQIESEYNKAIKNMKKYFKNDYSEVISNNTLKDISKIKDIKAIEKPLNNLNNLSKNIKSQQNITLDSKEIKEYNQKISNLTKSYTSYIDKIKKEEAKKEKIRKENAIKQQNSNTNNIINSKNNSSNSNRNNYSTSNSSKESYNSSNRSSSSSNSGNSSSSHIWKGWTTSEDDNKKHYFERNDLTGEVKTKDGSFNLADEFDKH